MKITPALYTPPLPDLKRAKEASLPEDTVFLDNLPPIQGDFPPPPQDLDRPVLMVTGFNGKPADWFTLKSYLGSNPDNGFGATYEAGKPEEFRQAIRANPDAKVFSIRFSAPHKSYRELAKELTEAVEILNQETGQEIDVVAHSMGGLVARSHLDNGHDGIRKLVMVATPNHGSLEADLALATDRLGVYKHYDEEAQQALLDLSLDTTFLKRQNNPILHGLNERWPQQRAKVEPTIIAGLGIPTPDYNWKLNSDGDGMVTARSAYLPQAEFVVSPSAKIEDRLFRFEYNHGGVLTHARVLQFVGHVLTRPSSGESQDSSGQESPETSSPAPPSQALPTGTGPRHAPSLLLQA